MAGVTSPSMWMWCLEDPVNGGKAFCNLNEGLGKVLRMGAFNEEVITRLRWMRDVLGPVLSKAVRGSIDAGNDPIDVKAILAQMLQMGDEGHNRNRAGSLMALRELSPSIVAVDAPSSDIAAVLKFIGGNEHFYLNLGMPTAKLAMDAARDVPGSTMVTVMARNGTEFGIQTAGTGDRWFTGPAQTPVGLFLGDYGPDDANPDIGDSAIMETYGVGGFSMAAAPAIVRFVGGSVPDALATTERMYQLTLAENPAMAIPIMGFRGVADRDRRPQGRAHRLAAADQHRDGRPGGRHRPGRCRAGAAAAGVLREGAGRAGRRRPARPDPCAGLQVAEGRRSARCGDGAQPVEQGVERGQILRAEALEHGPQVGRVRLRGLLELRAPGVGDRSVGDPPVGAVRHALDQPGRLHAVDQPGHAAGRQGHLLRESAHRELSVAERARRTSTSNHACGSPKRASRSAPRRRSSRP